MQATEPFSLVEDHVYEHMVAVLICLYKVNAYTNLLQYRIQIAFSYSLRENSLLTERPHLPSSQARGCRNSKGTHCRR